MTYRNTRTGSVIEIESELSGGDWVPYQPPLAKKPKKQQEEKQNGTRRSVRKPGTA